MDANAGYYLYELNRLASEKNVAILLTHHLVKLKDKKERTDVYLGGLYGISSFRRHYDAGACAQVLHRTCRTSRWC